MTGANHASAIQLTQNRHNATGTVDVFHMHIFDIWRDLAQTGHLAAEPIHVGHGEVNFTLMRDGQQVQHGIGRATHCDVEAHGIFKGIKRRNLARQEAFFVQIIVSFGDLDDPATSLEKQLFAVRVRSKRRAVARQGQPQRFGQTVHRVCGEHARARTAGRAGVLFDMLDLFVSELVVSSSDHRIQWPRRIIGLTAHFVDLVHTYEVNEGTRVLVLARANTSPESVN